MSPPPPRRRKRKFRIPIPSFGPPPPEVLEAARAAAAQESSETNKKGTKKTTTMTNPYTKATSSSKPHPTNNDNVNNKPGNRKKARTTAVSKKPPPVAAAAAPKPIPKRKRLQQATKPPQERRWRVFCDLDGVLADFDAGVQRLTGHRPSHLDARVLWSSIGRCPNFYANLPWTHDGKRLWHQIRDDLRPVTILTGCSRGAQVPHEKYKWCWNELGRVVRHVHKAAPGGRHLRVVPLNQVARGQSDEFTTNDQDEDMAPNPSDEREMALQRDKPHIVPVMTCWSRNKYLESGPGCVLIDDQEKHRADWERKGGVFILHTSADETLQQLKAKGIWTPPKTTNTAWGEQKTPAGGNNKTNSDDGSETEDETAVGRGGNENKNSQNSMEDTKGD